MSLLDAFEPVTSKSVIHCKGCASDCGSVRVVQSVRVMTCCGHQLTGPVFI